MSLPLHGMRILDLTRNPPGRHCTMLLSDMGAEVIEVEEIKSEVSLLGEAYLGALYERDVPLSPLERNKFRISLNLKHPEGLAVFQALSDKADIVVEGFRPGVMDRLGLGYDTLSKRNPKLIYCSVSGYGQDGPYKDLPGHDINYVAISGALDVVGPADGPPVPPYNLVGDYAGGGLHAVIGILFAILAREKSGRGQHVDVALTDGVISMVGLEIARYFARGVIAQRGKERPSGYGTLYRVYETKDGKYVTYGGGEPHFFRAFCRVIGREDIISWQHDPSRQEEMYECLRKVFLTRTRDEWFEAALQAQLAIGKVSNMGEVPSDPQVQHRKLVVEMKHPTWGAFNQIGHPIKYSDMQPEYRKAGSYYAEDTDRILETLGKSRAEIDRLRTLGAIL